MSGPVNKLYFGDCLDVMREDVDDESVDLIYLDPPFNSKRLYNAFIGGAQWVAFNDTWRWHEAVDDFHEVAGRLDIASAMEGLRLMLEEGPELAYLAYMANRLAECRRVLKPTGSIWLHCDPTMSHYLKVLMDGMFGAKNFKNEIVWRKYGGRKNNATYRFTTQYDVLLFYGASSNARFYPVFEPLSPGAAREYRHTDDAGRRYRMARRGKGYETEGGRRRIYLDESPGSAIGNLWTEKGLQLAQSAKERLGYPTQKPLALLERVVKAGSREGDVVLDPFCGCGTTLHAAQALRRHWIGIDVCVNACKVIEKRLRENFDSLWNDVEFIGMPKTRDDAKTLADLDKFRFERWAASLVDGMEANKHQRGDKGIDGYGRLPIRKGRFIDIVSQVKGAAAEPGDVQAFNGARQQAGADLGIFTCFEDRVTSRMRDAAASTGRFMDVQVVQIYTVEDYFAGRRPQMPKAA